jgi:hypothetical protein
MVIVLAATSLAGQLAAQKPAPAKAPPATQKPSPAKTPPAPPQTPAGQYVPAILQPRVVTLTGCLQHKTDYLLTEAMIAAASEKEKPQPAPSATYRLEGLSGARLSLLVGKRVEVTGTYQAAAPAAKGAKPDAGGPARFEATNANAVEGSCAAGN